jgi:hypothetical protein
MNLCGQHLKFTKVELRISVKLDAVAVVQAHFG